MISQGIKKPKKPLQTPHIVFLSFLSQPETQTVPPVSISPNTNLPTLIVLFCFAW